MQLRDVLRKEAFEVEPYIPGKTAEEVRRELGLERIVKLGSNENPYGPFPAAREAIEKEILNFSRYPDASFPELKAKIGALYGLTGENVAISHGAEAMVQTLAQCFLRPGDKVLIPTPTYGRYREVSRLMGASVVEIPLVDYRVDLGGVLERAREERPKLVWLCNPNNPTGTLFDPEAFGGFMKDLPGGTWVVLDEAYAEFADGKTPDIAALIGRGYPLVSVRTFSKAYGLAGLRLGYALAARELIEVIDRVREPFNANRAALAAAAAVLDDLDYVREVTGKILAERRRIEEVLRQMGLEVVPSETNFVFFDTGQDAAAVARQMLELGVIVRPGGGFGCPSKIRVSVGTPEENDLFLSALKRVLRRG